MSEYNKTILTNAGIDLARRANKGTATFQLTRGASSTDNLSGKTIEELQNLTQLPSVQQSVILSDVVNTTDNPDTVLGIRMTFDNQNLKTGYNVHTVGIYAKEPGKNEILYGIATAKTPEYIPDFGEQTLFKFDFLMYLVIGRADKVTVEVSPDDVYRKKDTYNKTEIDTKVSDAVSKLNNKDAEILKSLNGYKQENKTYHQNLEQEISRNFDKKADKTTVEQQFSIKADKSTTYTKDEVNSRISPKADKSYVDGELSKKADKTTVEQQFSIKADKSTTYTKDEVNSRISPKADKSYVDGELSKKADKTTVEQQFSIKADKSTTYTKDEVNSRISPKADKSYVDGELSKKADKTTVEQQFSIKADKSTTYTKDEVNSRISPKADKSYVDGELSKKADKSNTYTRNKIESRLSEKANTSDVNARLPLSGGQMNKGAFIHWNVGGINDKLGNIGGLSWQGATDNIRIFADENGNDNLDLAIQLGDDNSNHISFRDKNGTERAAITAGGHFTGGTDWARVAGKGLNNPTLGRYIQHSNTWNDIIGQNNGQMALTAIRDDSNGSENTIGQHSAGVAFGGGDTKGVLSVAWNEPHARIIGGNGNSPTWKKDIAWKDDINNANPSVTVINSFDVANVKEGPHQTWPVKQPWLVDHMALHPFAEAINSLKGQGTYRINNAVDVNTLTGIPNQVTVYILTNGNNRGIPIALTNPNLSDARGTLIVFNYDGNAKTQIWMPVGTSGQMGFAWRYWEGKYAPAWHTYYDTITSLGSATDSLREDMTKFQQRVDPNTPKGSFNKQTVNINDLRETGIYRFANCHIQNGPYTNDYAHWIYLKVTVFDANTVYQTLYEGDNMYGRKSSSPSDWGRWRRYLNEVI